MITKQRSSFTLILEIIALILVFAIILVCANADSVKRRFEKLNLPKEELEYLEDIKLASQEFGVDENFILAMIKVESDFDVDAVSRAGAMGLMQIMPDTYESEIKNELGLQIAAHNALLEPYINIRSGTYYIAHLLEHCDDVVSALAAYNAGIGKVGQWLADSTYSQERTDGKEGRVLISENIPYSETRKYVSRVMYYYEKYTELYPVSETPQEGEKYKDSPILWVTKEGYHPGQILVNDLCCYQWALKYSEIYKDVDPIFAMAIIKTESDFAVNAISPSGAYGLMQIMPDTYNIDIKPSINLEEDFEQLIEDPEFAVKCGMYYLHWLYGPSRGLNNSIVNVAAAYNGGCNAVKEWLGTEGLSENGELIIEKIPKPETKRYVEKVLANYEYFAKLYS